MIGREFKSRLATLMHEHNVRPVHPEPIPLIAPVTFPQIVEAWAATPDIDVDRMSFAPGSILWADPASVPLLVRHDQSRIAGRILSLEYQGGRLFARARIDDPDPRRMGGLSVCCTITDAEVRGEGAFVHGVVLKASLDHVAVTDRPANARALVTSRRAVTPMDDSHDAILASLDRARKALDDLKATRPIFTSAPQVIAKHLTIGAGPPHLYGRIPFAAMKSRPNSFSTLIAQLPRGE